MSKYIQKQRKLELIKQNFYLLWINKNQKNKTFELIDETDSPCVMGHLELNGFMATRGHFMEHGMDANIFDKFDKVFLVIII